MPQPSEQDFNAALQRVIATAPDGLSEDQFNALVDAELAPVASHAPEPRNKLMGEIDAMNARNPYMKRLAESAETGGIVSAAPTAVGQAFQQVAPGVSRALKSGAERMYSGLLKAKDATLNEFPTVVQDLLKARVPISQGGRATVIQGIKRIGAEKGELLKAADERAMVPRETFRRGLDKELDTAIATSEAPVKDMNRLAKVERDLLPDEMGVTPTRADKIKSKLQAEAKRGFTAAKTGNKVTDTTARAKMAVSHEAKTALEAIDPKLEGVNAAYASGKGQAKALRDTLKRTDKHNLVGMNDLIGAGVGGTVGGPVGGALGVLMMKIMNHPNTGSRTAIGLNELSRIPHLDQAAKAALLGLLPEQE